MFNISPRRHYLPEVYLGSQTTSTLIKTHFGGLKDFNPPNILKLRFSLKA